MPRPSTAAEPTGWVGWIIFAGTMLVILGIFHAIQGLVALFNDSVYLVGPKGLVINVDYTAWGWIHLIGGIVVVLAGVALFAGKMWARILAVIVAVVSAIINVLFLARLPDLVHDDDRHRRARDLGGDRARLGDEVVRRLRALLISSWARSWAGSDAGAGPGHRSTRPSAQPRRTASVRRDTPSLRRIPRTWVRTVLTDTNIVGGDLLGAEQLREVTEDLHLPRRQRLDELRRTRHDPRGRARPTGS